MRWRSALAAGLCGLFLGPLAADAKAKPKAMALRVAPLPLHAPPQADRTLDARLDGSRPIDTRVTHELFLSPVTETLDASPQVRLERYLWTAVPMARVMIFTDDKLEPVLAATLSNEQYRTWDALSTGNARRYLDAIATASFRARLPAALRSQYDATWRTGYADRTVAALERATPYIPYLESLARDRGLDERTWVLALQESFFTPDAVSRAWCEGAFQLSRPVARAFGLVVPTSSRGGNTMFVNESLHPLLAAQAAFDLVRAYSYITGGLLSGVSAYHTGPVNVARMRMLQLKNPDWHAGVKGIPRSVAVSYLASPNAVADDPIARDEGAFAPDSFFEQEAPRTTSSADALSWIITDGWRHPDNRSGYRRESAQYVPRFVALMNAIDRDALFERRRAIVGESVTQDPEGRCRSAGPYIDDTRPCPRRVAIMREIERYRFAAFEADRITVRYAAAQRIGREPLTGAQVAAAFPSIDAFRAANPHIPLRARIPEGTRVFLPLGAAQRFYELPAVSRTLRREDPVVYAGGAVSPPPAAPTALPADEQYARLALLRSEGRYDLVTKREVCDIADRMAALDSADPTWFRTLAARSSRLDCLQMDGKSARGLAIAAAVPLP